ncbi:hypothetical protein DQ04_14661010 [Trypanosoma grayi]|uniref:hypothetical protein n=1 Tax=Trypanosoma grayi TaxID=71804 RepID=UPI0004F45BB6|nr:hypothetical protein DQ04_14661010 [Trypanosoma grayi]KEG06315.1 hypothetical protein DQ04_14661010 [Trypanosoma grayi]
MCASGGNDQEATVVLGATLRRCVSAPPVTRRPTSTDMRTAAVCDPAVFLFPLRLRLQGVSASSPARHLLCFLVFLCREETSFATSHLSTTLSQMNGAPLCTTLFLLLLCCASACLGSVQVFEW